MEEVAEEALGNPFDEDVAVERSAQSELVVASPATPTPVTKREVNHAPPVASSGSSGVSGGSARVTPTGSPSIAQRVEPSKVVPARAPRERNTRFDKERRIKGEEDVESGGVEVREVNEFGTQGDDMKELNIDDEKPPTEEDLFTLNESVFVTLGRELVGIMWKLLYVLVPALPWKDENSLRDWDLWGPLLFVGILASALSLQGGDKGMVLTAVFVVVLVGSVVIWITIGLLGGKSSWLQTGFMLGYCLMPLDLSAICVSFWSDWKYRLVVSGIGLFWSSAAAWNFVEANMPRSKRGRIVLLLYPVFLFYFVIAWMVFVIPYTD